MNARRLRLAALGITCFAFALGAEWVSIYYDVPENHLLDLLSGLSYLVAGLIAMDRRPGNRIGPLLIAAGVAWFCGNYRSLGVPGLTSVLEVANALTDPFIVHIALSYPTGRLTTVLGRIAVIMMYGHEVARSCAYVLTWSPRAGGCADCVWTPAIWPSPAAVETIERFSNLGPLFLAPLALVALGDRLWRATPSERRDLRPLWAAAVVLAGVHVLESFAGAYGPQGLGTLMFQLRSLLQIGLPIIFLVGLLSARMVRSGIGDLVLELRKPLAPGALTPLIAQVLADPTVRILYAAEGGQRWIDVNGVSEELPSETDTKRAVTVMQRDGHPYAALIHLPGLNGDLVQGVATAAGMALQNESLQVEIRTQLEEVRASRARIVAAGDKERRRVERDLHDGAQQRLITLSLALHTARRQLAAGEAEAERTIQRASEELRLAMHELRELARGIHPTILIDDGLAPAVQSLADRAGIAVTVLDAPDERLPPVVEATAYFLVSEALANVAKHARATRTTVSVRSEEGLVHVEVIDDGIGGADPASGSGLRGLADRVAAVNGHVTVTSPTGGGTVVRARIPLPRVSVADTVARAATSPS